MPVARRYSSARLATRRGSRCVRLARHRVGDLADQRERGRLGERVEDRARRIGHQQHVRLRDALPAADRRAVEAEALVEGGLVERAQRQRHVLPARRAGRRTSGRPAAPASAPPTRAPPRGGSFLRPVRDVVLRLQLRHAASLLVGPTKKAPGLTRVPRPHCLGARLLRRAPEPTLGASADGRKPCAAPRACEFAPSAGCRWPRCSSADYRFRARAPGLRRRLVRRFGVPSSNHVQSRTTITPRVCRRLSSTCPQ